MKEDSCSWDEKSDGSSVSQMRPPTISISTNPQIRHILDRFECRGESSLSVCPIKSPLECPPANRRPINVELRLTPPPLPPLLLLLLLPAPPSTPSSMRRTTGSVCLRSWLIAGSLHCTQGQTTIQVPTRSVCV